MFMSPHLSQDSFKTDGQRRLYAPAAKRSQNPLQNRELQLIGVKQLPALAEAPAQQLIDSRLAIFTVSHPGMADGGQMGPYLMGLASD